MFTAEWRVFVIVLLVVVIVSIYWLQNNSLLGNLKKTDAIYTVTSIFQLFLFCCLFTQLDQGYVLAVVVNSRAYESIMVMIVGSMLLLAWHYAVHKGDLLNPELSAEDAVHIRQKNLADPILLQSQCHLHLWDHWSGSCPGFYTLTITVIAYHPKPTFRLTKSCH